MLRFDLVSYISHSKVYRQVGEKKVTLCVLMAKICVSKNQPVFVSEN